MFRACRGRQRVRRKRHAVGRNVLRPGFVKSDRLEGLAKSGLVHRTGSFVNEAAFHQHFEEAAQEMLFRIMELLVLVGLRRLMTALHVVQ